jgi:hypothetical protein
VGTSLQRTPRLSVMRDRQALDGSLDKQRERVVAPWLWTLGGLAVVFALVVGPAGLTSRK